MAFLGFAYLLAIVIDWFAGGAPFTGWAPIMVTILLLGGFIMMMLGVIGEYLWRIHDQVRERPMHVVLTSDYAQLNPPSDDPLHTLDQRHP